MSLSDYIVVGKIIATHGIKGWLTIKSFTSNPKDIFSYNLEININNKITSINIDDYNFMPKKITMKLKELSRIEDAEDYITKDILVHKNNLPNSNREIIFQLITESKEKYIKRQIKNLTKSVYILCQKIKLIMIE